MFDRPDVNLARYTMLKHKKSPVNPKAEDRKKLATKRFRTDGLSSLTTKVVHVKLLSLFTHILVDVGQQPPDVYNLF